MAMTESIIKGKTIHFTGQFELDPQYRAERLGATIVKSMSKDVDWVVTGPGPSSIRLEQAQNLGIKVLDEEQFFELVDPNAWIENEPVRQDYWKKKSGGQPKMSKDASKLKERWK
jgi:BRCT domain type II-containing protein